MHKQPFVGKPAHVSLPALLQPAQLLGGEVINIFTVASGHMYERLQKIMVLSVIKNTQSRVKFWFIKNYMSPQHKQVGGGTGETSLPLSFVAATVCMCQCTSQLCGSRGVHVPMHFTALHAFHCVLHRAILTRVRA